MVVTHSLYDFIPFKFIETCFVSQNVIYLVKGLCILKMSIYILLFLCGVVYESQLDQIV